MSIQHNNVEKFDQCECDSPAGDPLRYEFPGGESVEMVGCLNCGGVVEVEIEVDYSPDEITPDDLTEGGECATHNCDDTADVIVQLRRDLRSITSYCDGCWEERKKRSELRVPHNREVLAKVVDGDDE